MSDAQMLTFLVWVAVIVGGAFFLLLLATIVATIRDIFTGD